MFFDWSTLKKLIWLRAAGIIGAVWKTITNAAVATFTAVAAPVRALVIDITPVQSGSGDPSPENVRPISGWTGANVWVEPTHDTMADPTLTVSWQSAAGTVYGGTLDVTTGVLTVTMADVDLGTLTWTKSDRYQYFYSTSAISGIRPHYSQIVAPNVIMPNCATVDPKTQYDDITLDNTVSVSGIVAQIRMLSYADAVAFKTAMSGVPLVYELATPQTYQLTPAEVTTLLGQNNVWADTGNINTITYRES